MRSRLGQVAAAGAGAREGSLSASSAPGELAPRLDQGLLGDVVDPLTLFLQVLQKGIQLRLDALAQAGEHHCDQRGQRQLPGAGKGVRVFRGARPVVEVLRVEVAGQRLEKRG